MEPDTIHTDHIYSIGGSMNDDPVNSEIIRKFEERFRIGMERYGIPISDWDVSIEVALKEAQEEAMDLVVYLEWLIQKVKNGARSKHNDEGYEQVELPLRFSGTTCSNVVERPVK